MEHPVVILGTEPLAQLAAEILQRNKILVYGFLAETTTTKTLEIDHIPILDVLENGQQPYLEILAKNGVFFMALAHMHVRKKYIQQLEAQQLRSINVIHPMADLATTAKIGKGNLLDANVLLSPNSHVADYCLLHKQVTVGHGAAIASNSQIGYHSIIGDQVTIKENVFIGIGVTIVAGITIGAGASVGAGSVVLNDVPAHEVVLGNPAKPVVLS